MAEFKRKPSEPLDKILRKFKRKVKEEGILLELRKREFYEKPSEIKKRTTRAAVRKNKAQSSMDDW